MYYFTFCFFYSISHLRDLAMVSGAQWFIYLNCYILFHSLIILQLIYLHWNVNKPFGSVPVWSYADTSALIQEPWYSNTWGSLRFLPTCGIHRGHTYHTHTHTYPSYEFQAYPLYLSNLTDIVKLSFQRGPLSQEVYKYSS